jgi:type 1 glutamine amidotransferase
MAFLLVACSLTAADGRLRVLILSGQNNHDWRATTPKLRSILTNTARFEVDITDHPENGNRSSFDSYDVLLSNWNTFGSGGTKEWPAATREAFLQFVRSGKGLVVVHAGGSSFPDWQEYQDLIGGTWGAGTGHGPVHEFQVRITQPDHPITRGLSSFKITDELWHRMATRTNKVVLATAFSARDRGGSGADEPVAFITRFGQGRCFNLVLGHDVKAMEADGFQTLLVRGTEWAARGTVTVPNPSGAK